ncbi:hypothetical protein P4639_22025 [Priestia megaterium]|uniref:hypothetical protein n=1 Tax=Priestia megaterium TaxID=1404 RepID=UPI002E1A0A9A|nr:hypothetical protein [Priestia megaterium]
MKIIKSIEKVLPKKSSTIRQDVVRRAIERGEFELIKCAYHLTDDYAWDAVNNFGYDKKVSKEYMLKEYSILTPSCWISGKKLINGKMCYEISISFHSNLAYDMYVPAPRKKINLTKLNLVGAM